MADGSGGRLTGCLHAGRLTKLQAVVLFVLLAALLALSASLGYQRAVVRSVPSNYALAALQQVRPTCMQPGSWGSALQQCHSAG